MMNLALNNALQLQLYLCYVKNFSVEKDILDLITSLNSNAVIFRKRLFSKLNKSW